MRRWKKWSRKGGVFLHAWNNHILACRKCTLDVVELPCEYEFKGEDTILDICLDYFSTWNPFLKSKNEREKLKLIGA